MLRSCCCSEESVAIFRDDADIATASDLVRYCAADDDGGSQPPELGLRSCEPELEMLALETGNAVSMTQLRKLVGEARALCEATTRLSESRSTAPEVDVS